LLADGQPKTISVEEMVHITDSGAEYLIPPQQDLVLITSIPVILETAALLTALANRNHLVN
jgi:hypothetical protein